MRWRLARSFGRPTGGIRFRIRVQAGSASSSMAASERQQPVSLREPSARSRHPSSGPPYRASLTLGRCAT